MTTIPPLYLLHTQPDARLLAAWMARHHARHARQSADLGDALHGLLRAAFGEHAPQPFRYLDERQGLLAYTPLDEQAMAAQVALADPLTAQALGLVAGLGDAGGRCPAGAADPRDVPDGRDPGGDLDRQLPAGTQDRGRPGPVPRLRSRQRL